jgi:hypothetical protein
MGPKEFGDEECQQNLKMKQLFEKCTVEKTFEFGDFFAVRLLD